MMTVASSSGGGGAASRAESEARESDAARRALRVACVAVIGIAFAGLAAIPSANTLQYRMFSLFFEQFARIEALPLLLVIVFACIVLMVLHRSRPSASDPLPSLPYRPWIIIVGAVCATAIGWAGVHLIFHNYMLADDEFSAWFQAVIFAHRRMSATVSPEWCRYIGAITPTSINSFPATCSWQLSFLPIHSLVQAPFIAAGVGRLGVPLLNGLSLVLITSIARKIWPDRPTRSYVAALFFLTSTQMLFMSMTMFSMPTHLFFSLCWLWVYVDDRRWANVVLPWMGFIAIGVHSPYPHLLMVPPFVLRYLWRRRFVMFAYVSGVYLFALTFWFGYINALSRAAANPTTSIAGVGATVGVTRGFLHLPPAWHTFVTAMHLALVPSWNAPIAIILAVVAMLSWRSLDSFARDATLSVLLTLGVRLFIPTPQGEGWGYRFIYDVLGCLALLSALGAEEAARAIGGRNAARLIGASAAIALLVQVPVRAVGVNRIVGPFGRGYEWLSTINADAVLYPANYAQWGRQLLRNDPFLRNRPKLLETSALSVAQRSALQSDPKWHVVVLTRDSLQAHGIPLRPLRFGSLLVVPTP